MTKTAGSLQQRLLVLTLSVVMGTWFAAAAATWFDTRHELDELLDSHLAQAAALLVVQQARDIDEGEGVDSPSLHRYAPKVAFQVYHEGRLALRSANAPATPMIASGTGFRSGFATVRIDGAAWRVFAAYGAERDVQVYVAERLESRASILWAVLRSMFWPIAVALPLLAMAIWWAVRFGVKPLHRLGATLDERQPDALQPIATDGIPSEMLPMILALNGLFERIGTLLDSERRFTADAAHELRTPIAAIRMQAQVALGESDDALRRHALQGTLEGCDRATRLVEQLLTLSRLDADVAPAMANVDLVAVARRVVSDLAPVALARAQAVEVTGDTQCIVRGNETLLHVFVRNLVDNAMRYSQASAAISVNIVRRKDLFALAVEDNGPGLTDAELGQLGERFFRVTGTGQSGSGLGWSIVRRIADAHRFSLAASRSTERGGLVVRVSGKPEADPIA